MGRSPGFLLFRCAIVAVAACDPYAHFGEHNESLGPVDPVNFPPANLGANGKRLEPGQGVFTEIHAFAGGALVGYFAYPVPALPASADPLRVLDNAKPYPAVPTPAAYVFDPDADSGAPFPAKSPCAAPAGYAYDRRRDDVRYDETGSIFTALPKATYTAGVAVSSSYVPIVQQLAVTASGQPCQALKSEEQAKATFPDAKPGSEPRYLAWLIIDPGAGVYAFDAPKGDGGVTLQRWGWYGGYLLAYLDGGYIPTLASEVMAGMATKPVVRMATQKLFYPRSPVTTTDAEGVAHTAPGAIGGGYDVLEAKRGDAGYSPVCEVFTYDTMTTLDAAALPTDVAAITATYGATVQPATTKYVYCLQARVVPPKMATP